MTKQQDHRTRVGMERRRRTRLRLLESAMRVFAEKGIDATSIDDVIADAGISRGSFYNYFRTTTELLGALSEELGNEAMSSIEEAIADLPGPVARLSCGLRLFLHYARLNPDLSRFIWQAGFHAASPSHLLFEFVPAHIHDGIEEGLIKVEDPEISLHIIGGAMLAALFDMSTNRRSSNETYPEKVVLHLLRALGINLREQKRVIDLPLPDLELTNDSLLLASLSRQ